MYKYFKRLFDIFFSIVALLILSPLFFVLICLLMITGEKEVFYGQERVGYKNKKFKIWKFATMVKNSPNIGNGDVTLRDDPRTTTIGKYLRMTKINEFPQLFNILKGDMSVVGPRPLMEAGFLRYSFQYQNMVYNTKPGLTGIGALAFRDEEKILTESNLTPHECYEKVILPYKGALEVWYQEKISFFVDIQILVLTFWVILFPESNLYLRIFQDLPNNTINIPIVHLENKKEKVVH